MFWSLTAAVTIAMRRRRVCSRVAGMAGIVLDGAVFDLAELQCYCVPVWVRGLFPSRAAVLRCAPVMRSSPTKPACRCCRLTRSRSAHGPQSLCRRRSTSCFAGSMPGRAPRYLRRDRGRCRSHAVLILCSPYQFAAEDCVLLRLGEKAATLSYYRKAIQRGRCATDIPTQGITHAGCIYSCTSKITCLFGKQPQDGFCHLEGLSRPAERERWTGFDLLIGKAGRRVHRCVDQPWGHCIKSYAHESGVMPAPSTVRGLDTSPS
jgi:hypothetical protein